MTQETSKIAYIGEILPTLGERQQTVLKALTSVPDATHRELKEMLGWEINTVTPRVGELVNLGHVEEAGKRQCRITKRMVIAWRSTLAPSPSNFACTLCPKVATAFYHEKPVCEAHRPKEGML